MPSSTSQVQTPSISEIIPGLFIGNGRALRDAPTIQSNHIKATTPPVAGPHIKWSQPGFKKMIPHHLWIECVDTSTQDLLQHMTRCCDFIDMELESGAALSTQIPYDSDETDEPQVGGVLVHCDEGISRSATIIIAYLVRKRRQGLDEVLEEVRGKRHCIKPNANFLAQLQIWDKVQYQIWNVKKEIPKTAYKEFLDKRAAKLKEKGLTGNEVYRPLIL